MYSRLMSELPEDEIRPYDPLNIRSGLCESQMNMEEDSEVDYSYLPEVVWVQILSYLELVDRSHIAQTCHKLNDLFNHPSLWSEMMINMLGDQQPYNSIKNLPVVINEKNLILVERFGPYFQNLTLKLHGFLKNVPKNILDIVSELSKDCRLERLTFDVGTMLSHDHYREYYSFAPDISELDVFAQLIRNAFRLKCFTLNAWPRFQNKPFLDILQVLMDNPKLSHLEELSLYWFNAGQGCWTTNNALLPEPEEIHCLVKNFKHLTTLKLRSTMLNDDIVEELSEPGRQPLKNLSIIVTYTAMERASSIKTISQSAWLKLRKYSPNVEVDFTIMTRIPFIELASLLVPGIRLTAITFMRYSRCGALDISSLMDKYKQTLTKFVDYTDGTNCDEELLALVTQCKSLNHLIYNGTLNQRTVLKLAHLRSEWSQFNFNIENIDTRAEMVVQDDDDDDCVLRVGPDGSYSTPMMRNYEDEEEREQALKILTDKISNCIGYNWCPLTQK